VQRKTRIRYMHWLWRLARQHGTIEESDVNREGGKIYDFPKCCIDNYVRLMERGESPGKFMDELYGFDDCRDISENPRVRCAKCRKSQG
jgi:hypothetical protein